MAKTKNRGNATTFEQLVIEIKKDEEIVGEFLLKCDKNRPENWSSLSIEESLKNYKKMLEELSKEINYKFVGADIWDGIKVLVFQQIRGEYKKQIGLYPRGDHMAIFVATRISENNYFAK
jgi:hypothetical protein